MLESYRKISILGENMNPAIPQALPDQSCFRIKQCPWIEVYPKLDNRTQALQYVKPFIQSDAKACMEKIVKKTKLILALLKHDLQNKQNLEDRLEYDLYDREVKRFVHLTVAPEKVGTTFITQDSSTDVCPTIEAEVKTGKFTHLKIIDDAFESIQGQPDKYATYMLASGRVDGRLTKYIVTLDFLFPQVRDNIPVKI